jgi:hypothetical protein
MNEGELTPGPWRALPPHKSSTFIAFDLRAAPQPELVYHADNEVARAYGLWMGDGGPARVHADARLIAALPIFWPL